VVSEYIADTPFFPDAGAIAGRTDAEVDDDNVGRPPGGVKIAPSAPTGRAPARPRVPAIPAE
jgi:hypothetical protein